MTCVGKKEGRRRREEGNGMVLGDSFIHGFVVELDAVVSEGAVQDIECYDMLYRSLREAITTQKAEDGGNVKKAAVAIRKVRHVSVPRSERVFKQSYGCITWNHVCRMIFFQCNLPRKRMRKGRVQG